MASVVRSAGAGAAAGAAGAPSSGKLNVLYPAYIDSLRSVEKGRRVGKKHCVERPFMQDMVLALRKLGVPCVEEPTKSFPRDFWYVGRVRVALSETTGPAGAPYSKKQLLVLIAQTIKKLPEYQQRLAAMKAKAKGGAAAAAAGASPAPAAPAGSGSGLSRKHRKNKNK